MTAVTKYQFELPSEGAQIFWALVDYSRWFVATDAPFLERILANNGRFDVPTLSSVLTKYDVARGFPAATSVKFGKLIDVLHHYANGWPDRMMDRCEHCIGLASSLKRKGLTQKLQVSAATKTMWFLNPEGWTLFDKLAADGMNAPAHLSAEKKAQYFYAHLESCCFEGLQNRLFKLIQQSEWRDIPAARVFDFVLMNRSNSQSASVRKADCTGYLNALPRSASDSLIALARKAQNEFGNDILPPVTRKRRGRRTV
ncbi:hypothetical protein [Roseibium album]|uniref:hypothetical protein n=1 Tax=Roseibium album TaxID=311410 RepID=UPI0024904A68|nr:hypothetical protein [Roseibium album]